MGAEGVGVRAVVVVGGGDERCVPTGGDEW